MSRCRRRSFETGANADAILLRFERFCKAFQEDESDIILRLFEPLGVDAKSISALAELEVRSAIRRRERSGDLTEEHAGIALTFLSKEAVRLRMEPITGTVLRLAATVIDNQGLRTLDAIQLATALVVDRSAAQEIQVVFVTFDDKLRLAADAEGLSTWKSASVQP